MGDNMNERIIDIYDKYVPKNITLEQFAQIVERDPELLDSIGGEFSTFNAKIAQAFKETDLTSRKSKNAFKTMVKDSLDDETLEQRAQEIAKIYEEIISSNDEILTAAWTFDILTAEQKQQLATNFINALNKRLHIDKIIKYVYTDDALNQLSSDAPYNKLYKFIKKFISRFSHNKYKHGKIGGYYSMSTNKIVMGYEYFFQLFMSTLSHEYGHFIDRNYPNLGMLGSQIAFYDKYTNSSLQEDYDGYKLNPTEISSYTIGINVGIHLTKVLREQQRKKPELYIKTLESAIDMMKLKIDAKYLRAQKAKNEYYNIKNKIRSELYPIFYLLPQEEQNKVWDKIDKDSRLRDYAKVKKEYFDIYIRVQDEYYPDFYSLPREEHSKIRVQINHDPRVIKYWQRYDELNKLRNKLCDEQYPFFAGLPIDEQNKIMAKIEKMPRVKIALLRYKLASSEEYSELSTSLHTYESLLDEFKKSMNLNQSKVNAISM